MNEWTISQESAFLKFQEIFFQRQHRSSLLIAFFNFVLIISIRFKHANMFTRIAVVGAISAGMTLNLNRRKAYCSPVPAGGYTFDTRVSETFAR
jgi:hypothetical protein